MTKHFELPLIYLNNGKAPRKVRSGNYPVQTVATFAFPEAEVSELEPALSFISQYRPDTLAVEFPIKQCRGRLIRPMEGNGRFVDYRVLDTVVLANLKNERPKGLPKELWVDSMRHQYEYGWDIVMADAVKPRHVVKDGLQAAITELQNHINQSLIIIDHVLYRNVPDPSWNIWFTLDGKIQVDATLSDHGHFVFPANCRDLVNEFTDWCVSNYHLDPVIDDKHFIRVNAVDIPLTDNPIIKAANMMSDRASYLGRDADELKKAFQLEKNVSSALEFIHSLEALSAHLPHDGQERIHSGLDNSTLFAMFRKFYELLPDGYKVDDVSDIVVDLSEPDETDPSFRM